MNTKVNVLKKKQFKNAVMFVGLPGIGLVGKIALDHLISELKPEKFAEIVSDSFPPSVRTEDGVLDLIKNELYSFSYNKQDFIFLVGPVQPALDFRGFNSLEHYEFASSIVESAKSFGVDKIFTLAGLNVAEKRMNKEPSIVVAGTDKDFLKEFSSFDGVRVDKGEGLISGAAGLILGYAKEQGMKGLCLMGETSSSIVYGDHGSAKKVLELLSKKFGFKVNLSEIDKESKKIEKAFTSLSEQLKKEEDDFEDKPSYVR